MPINKSNNILLGEVQNSNLFKYSNKSLNKSGMV